MLLDEPKVNWGGFVELPGGRMFKNELPLPKPEGAGELPSGFLAPPKAPNPVPDPKPDDCPKGLAVPALPKALPKAGVVPLPKTDEGAGAAPAKAGAFSVAEAFSVDISPAPSGSVPSFISPSWPSPSSFASVAAGFTAEEAVANDGTKVLALGSRAGSLGFPASDAAASFGGSTTSVFGFSLGTSILLRFASGSPSPDSGALAAPCFSFSSFAFFIASISLRFFSRSFSFMLNSFFSPDIRLPPEAGAEAAAGAGGFEEVAAASLGCSPPTACSPAL
mmetsp:Transcript_15663/g.25361  ORF Transcript_15663/g.25361 Transcript_15663/m.25361 type:complete len:278 (-) Transcript_15663:1619-2452(-)